MDSLHQYLGLLKHFQCLYKKQWNPSCPSLYYWCTEWKISFLRRISMRHTALIVASLTVASLFLCSPTKSGSNSEFSNRLTLGTGQNTANPFNLTGVGISFAGAPLTLYWRLESSDDMAGSSVIIDIKKAVNSVYSSYKSQTYPSSQSYGHIMVSAITIDSTGYYRATGILATGNKTISTVDFTVQ
jgi:hypothetical protein